MAVFCFSFFQIMTPPFPLGALLHSGMSGMFLILRFSGTNYALLWWVWFGIWCSARLVSQLVWFVRIRPRALHLFMNGDIDGVSIWRWLLPNSECSTRSDSTLKHLWDVSEKIIRPSRDRHLVDGCLRCGKSCRHYQMCESEAKNSAWPQVQSKHWT